MKKIIFILLSVVMVSCAKIPVQSVTLMHQIQQEGERMHKLNVAYVNKLFNEKLDQVNAFIQNEYTPDLLSNIKSGLQKAGIDMNEKWDVVFAKTIPQINAYKDSLTRALDQNRVKIITKLNQDFQVYQQACELQLNMLNSAAKVNTASKNAADAVIKKFTGNKADLGKLESILNKYLKKGETASNMVLTLYNDINDQIIANI
jgi:hypothetical protein